MGYFRNMKKVSFREAQLSDLSILKAFEQEIIKAERPFDNTIKPDPVSYYSLEEYIENPAVKVIVAQIDGQIIASGYAFAKKARHYLDHENYAYLGFLYCKPNFRGQGIIQQLINNLKQWAKSKGLLEVRLTVYQDNNRAIKAYQKCGFSSHINEMRMRLK